MAVKKSKLPTSPRQLAGLRGTSKTQELNRKKITVIKKVGGLTVDVYNVKGKVVGKTALPKQIFSAKINSQLLAQAVRVYLANQRKGTASTKTRGEIRASTRKIYRQKGTGRARHGAVSAPIFRGGGIAFGPKPRDYSLKLPKKMRKIALLGALTSKAKQSKVKIVEGLEKITPKTKSVNELIKNIEGTSKNKKTKTLLVLPQKVETIQRAARNIEGVTIRPVSVLNTYEVLNNNVLIFMKESIGKLEELWNK